MADLMGNLGSRHVGAQSRLSSRATRMAVAALFSVVALGVCAASASAGVVTITLSGSHPGRVVSPPGTLAGIDCSNIPGQESTDCSFDYYMLRGLPLTATGGAGAALREWTTVVGSGGTCSGGLSPCVTGLLNGGPITLDARFGPIPEPPSVVTGDVSDIRFPSARVSGDVSPNSNAFALTGCRFEYGVTSSYGRWAPCEPNVTTGVNPTPVAATLGVLEPNTAYHYRLKATNAGGTVVGGDATFTTGPAPADSCPNAVVRAQQGALGMSLPDCLAYELVTPTFTAGGMSNASLDEGEDLISLYSFSGFGGVLSNGVFGARYMTERTATGWKTTAIAPPAKDFPSAAEQIDVSSDQRRYLSYDTLKVDEGTDRKTPVVRDEDGTFAVAGPTLGSSGAVSNPGVMGTSANLDMVVTRSGYRPVLTDGTTDTRPANRASLQASTRDGDGNLVVRQVAYRAGATMFPTCNIVLGSPATARASVSADGSKVFFTSDGIPTCRTGVNGRVWAKIGAADPIDLSASRCDDGNCGAAAVANFVGAARDGSRVYFTTQQKLVNGDQDTASKTDLYEYDFGASGEELRPVTVSMDAAGAGVLGVTRVSDDGSHVYFVANGRPLAGPNARGVAPQVGGQNLYVYHRVAGEAEGTTTFVGALDPGEMTAGSQRPAKASSGSGRFLVFASTANLTDEKQPGDTFSDLYRFDARNDELRRIWSNDPAHNGAARIATADFAGIPESIGSQGAYQSVWLGDGGRQISDDGATIVFVTKEPLSPWDANTQSDVYMWRANTGRLTMLSDGYADAPTGVNANVVTTGTGMSRSGNSIFLKSYRPLLAAHSSGQVAAFAVRVNGGFPKSPKPPTVCVGDACQEPGATPPGSPEIGTGKDSGSGNVPAVARGVVSVVSPKAVRGTGVVLRVKAPGEGRLKLSGAAVRGSSKTVAKAGSYRIAVRLTPRAAQRLRKTGRLGVKVQVAFRPVTGRSSSQAVSVTFKTQKAGKKGGR